MVRSSAIGSSDQTPVDARISQSDNLELIILSKIENPCISRIGNLNKMLFNSIKISTQ